SDDCAEHDPGTVPPGDQQRVLAVEADTASCRRLTVDVLVRIDEYAVGATDFAPELVELPAQLCVRVVPCVARQATVPRGALGLGRVVAEGRGDDGARACEQRLGMARALRLRHRELPVGEQAARLSFADVPFRLL